MTPSPDEAADPEVRHLFERKRPGKPRYWPGTLVGYFAGIGLAVGIGSAVKRVGLFQDLVALFGEGQVYTGLALMALVFGLLIFLAVDYPNRVRYGRCELTPYMAYFYHRDIDPPVVTREVAQEDVRGWQVTPHGLLLEVEGYGPIASFMRPFLVPTRDPSEVELAVRLLQGKPG